MPTAATFMPTAPMRGADVNDLLLESARKLGGILTPPRSIQGLGDDLDHDHVILFAMTFRGRPDALRWRAEVRGDAAEPVHQFMARACQPLCFDPLLAIDSG